VVYTQALVENASFAREELRNQQNQKRLTTKDHFNIPFREVEKD